MINFQLLITTAIVLPFFSQLSIANQPPSDLLGENATQAKEASKQPIELFIDSDNNNGFEMPDLSAWEREIKTNDFSLGKLLEVGAKGFVPVVIQLHMEELKREAGDQVSSENCRVDFKLHEPLGEIALWTTPQKNSDSTQIRFNTSYTLRELNFNSASSSAVVYIEGVKAAPYTSTKDDIDRKGRPNMFLGVEMFVLDDTKVFLGKMFEDKVKYLPVEPNSFFTTYVLPENRRLRDAIAASLVNGRQGFDGTAYRVSPLESRDFGLRLVKEAELFNETFTDEPAKFQQRLIVDTLYDRRYCPILAQDYRGVVGLQLVLYKDYNSGLHTLAFQNVLSDSLLKFYTIAPRRRAIRLNDGIGVRQQAGVLAFFLKGFVDNQQLKLNELRLTGVGIGGEHAVFAALGSGVKANVFNTPSFSAHLADIVLTVQASRGSEEYRELIPGSLARIVEVGELVDGFKVSEIPFEVTRAEFELTKSE